MDNTKGTTQLILSSSNKDLETALSTLGYQTIIDVLPILQAEMNSEKSWRVYRQDIKTFVAWLRNRDIDLATIERIDLLNYRKDLQDAGRANITINRMFSVARVLIKELCHRGSIITRPLEKAFKPLYTSDETTHTVLNEKQAKQLLQAIDTHTVKGKRDYAMVSLMLRCGLRRDEVVKLHIADITTKSGHCIASVIGKGNKPAIVKIPADVQRRIQTYLDALYSEYSPTQGVDTPLFISLRKGGTPSLKAGQIQAIDPKGIEKLVIALGQAIGVPDLTPHGLRATFITLAMEHGASLEQAQYAARHSDPRTTERYRARKLNLDDNAVDKLSFLASDENE